MISNNLVARNFGVDASALNVNNDSDPTRNLLITGNMFRDNRSVYSNGGVSLATFSPSLTFFLGNTVLGDSAGNLISCIGGGSYAFANIVINRNPLGSGNTCSH